MESTYEPSFEVVDKAEDVEDYLTAKHTRTAEPKQTTECLETENTSTISDLTIKDEDKMNFNALHFLSGKSECKDVDNDKNVLKDCDAPVLPCITEDEEGQEALWVEESETTPSAASANPSPTVKKSSSKRSSFLFGSVRGASIKVAKVSPKRTISLRKKKYVPKVMLLDGLPDVKSTGPALSSDEVVDITCKEDAVVAGKAVSQDAVIRSDTISSLGFDKSFDVKSPLSMSSLNEILDAPPTPTTAMEESAAIAPTVKVNQKRSKTRSVTGMFRKKEKKVKSKNSFSFMSRSRYARSVTVVEKEGKEDDDSDDADPVLFATRDINERIHASLMRAMENDDAESLTSFTGVPLILNEVSKDRNKMNDMPKTLTILQGQKPLNFEKVKPTFVISKDGLTMAEIQEKFVPMYDDDEDDEENDDDDQNLTSPCDNIGEHVETLKSRSPNSTGADSVVTDRYEVAQDIGDDNESDCDDGKSDKYSVLPDPCSFCDSFWVSTDKQAFVSETISDSPYKIVEQNSHEPESLLDSPVIDKYAEAPEVAANAEDDDDVGKNPNITEEAALKKSKTVTISNRTFSRLFGIGKHQSTVSALPLLMPVSSNVATSRDVEPALSEPEEHHTSESTSNECKVDVENKEPILLSTDVESEKHTKSSFFGKMKKPFTSKSKSTILSSEQPTSGLAAPAEAISCGNMSKTVMSATPPTVLPRKSILKKRKEVMMIPIDEPSSYIVPGYDLESPGAKISVVSLGSEPYVVPAATSVTVTSKSTVSLEQHPIEDPSTEGSSSADDDVATSKIVSIAPISPTKSSSNDPLLTRLRKNIHKRRGLEPQTGLDPIIAVGNGRTRLDP